jgi:tetratricopeptide (TPR) repeat protein
MKILVLACFIVVTLTGTAIGQAEHQALWDVYNSGDEETALAEAMRMLEIDDTDRDLRHLVGRCLVDLGMWEEGRPHLEYCVEGGPRDWRYAWSLLYLGTIDAAEGRYDAAREAWTEVRDSRITANAARDAGANLRFFGLDEAFAAWPRRQTEHLDFLFSPAYEDEDLDRYAQAHELAYAELTRAFGGGPEYPVRYVVWEDVDEARKMAGIGTLGFSRPEYNIIHCLWPQTIGHELAHVVIYHALSPVEQTRFINEGLAVAFDLTDRDQVERAIEAVRGSGEPVDLLQIWNDPESTSAEVLYSVAGAWIQFLVERGDMDRIRELARNQTVEAAREIYGQEFDATVAEFEMLVNGG